MTTLLLLVRCGGLTTSRCLKTAWVWLALAGFWLGAPAPGRADFQENFESPEPSLRLADADCSAEIVSQQRVFQNARRGVGCERLVIRAGRGTRVYLEQPITPAQVIDELKINLWVKGDRPGFQILARVVLPKSLDRRTGQPLTTLVWGSSYRDVGNWQVLTLASLPTLVQRQVRIMSSERSEPIDGRQAYLDKIVINAFGGSGLTQIWVDDLEIEGHATPAWWRDGAAPTEFAHSTVNRANDNKVTKGAAAPTEAGSLAERDGEPHVRLQGSVLVANGRPLFPRGVIHRGESLAWLKSLGLNTVLLSAPLTREQQAAAQKLDLWLVVPGDLDPSLAASVESPSSRSEPNSRSERSTSPFTFASAPSAPAVEFDPRSFEASSDRILAVLASPPAKEQPSLARDEHAWGARLRLVRESSRGAGPSVAATEGDLFLVELPDSTIATSAIAPNRPTWYLVDTERLVRETLDRASSSAEQRQQRFLNALRGAALRCVSEGARGWCLTNALPGALREADVPLWTTAMETVQRELDLINPWISAGTVAEPLVAPAPGWRACALEANRARLVIVTRQPVSSTNPLAVATTDLKPGASARSNWGETTRRFTSASVPTIPLLDLVDSGAPTSTDAYLLGGAALRPLVRQRVAGGVRVRVETPDVAALVVLTQDPLVVNYLARRGAQANPSWTAPSRGLHER